MAAPFAKLPPMKISVMLPVALLLAGAGLCAQEQAAPARKALPERAEPFLLLPEPRAMRVGHSVVLGGARRTVFTPVRRAAGSAKLEPYSKEEFAKLGVSPDNFAEKARQAADRLLASLQPELIRDDAGRVRYAVYRGEEPIFACLLVAPSLATVFQNVFGKEIWVAAPDRHSLYVFPPNPAVVDDFAGDLQQRFESDAFAASEEVFVISGDPGVIRAAGTFNDH